MRSKECFSRCAQKTRLVLLVNDMILFSEDLGGWAGKSLAFATFTSFCKPDLVEFHSDRCEILFEMIGHFKMPFGNRHHKGVQGNQEERIGVLGIQHQGQTQRMPNGYRKEMIKIPMPELERSQYPMEWGKTLLAFLYALCCFVLTTVMISVVHERVPPKEVQPPLPDTFFDHFNRVQWAFSICEINGMILVGLWLVQWLLLKYKSIISRRFFCIVGTLYLYRCITMYVTTLPVPGMHFNCSPKKFQSWEAQLRRIMKLIAGGGLSITGSHNMCGDYLYSGHTVMLTLTYLFIKEYSPRRLWWYHWICWLLSVVGIFCILLAHDHYTVDVVVAYYITTRLFWWYHTMANQQVLKEASQMNLLARVWWYRPFQYFEKNVQGIVPRSYHWPFPWPVVHLSRPVKYSRLVNDT
ncbi:hypothetical protein QTO34_006041 [Cnephaeus nilssonii]|uniref:Sphingomyelin synthase-like domain-containing protein n=1 Tax=Cnephaeus nilssonii TaxID=3371016 RepID=A0AA40HLX0_CNENI|nr:hypothetical protein QTO34_006041 [Eptesicus nilssonii]